MPDAAGDNQSVMDSLLTLVRALLAFIKTLIDRLIALVDTLLSQHRSIQNPKTDDTAIGWILYSSLAHSTIRKLQILRGQRRTATRNILHLE